jgi:hypothetical protein
MTVELLLMLIALALFVAAAAGVPANGRFNLMAAGLAFLTLALLVPTLSGG